MFSQYANPQQSNISVAFINSGKPGAQAFTVGAGNTVFLIDCFTKKGGENHARTD